MSNCCRETIAIKHTYSTDLEAQSLFRIFLGEFDMPAPHTALERMTEVGRKRSFGSDGLVVETGGDVVFEAGEAVHEG